MDWQAFVDALPERERIAIECLLEGKSLRDAAHVLQVSDSAMQASKRELRVKILEFMGANILVEIQRRPQWKDGLEAIREKMACRYDRCH
jgi:transposase